MKSTHLETIYKSFILSQLDYGDVIYAAAPNFILDRLDRFHYQAACSISGVSRGSNTEKTLGILNWTTLYQRRKEHLATLIYKSRHLMTTWYITQLFTRYMITPIRALRDPAEYRVKPSISLSYKKSTIFNSMIIWNSLPAGTRQCESLSKFKSGLRQIYLNSYIITSSHLTLSRREECYLNKLRVDFLLRDHLYKHNWLTLTQSSLCICLMRKN